MTNHDDDDHDDTECVTCGGEGVTYGCSWDWQCDTYDEGDGTCLCERRCDWCQPLKVSDLPLASHPASLYSR